jgi:hypothetical protein
MFLRNGMAGDLLFAALLLLVLDRGLLFGKAHDGKSAVKSIPHTA